MRSHPVLRCLAVGIFLGLLSADLAIADELGGKIRGTVSDPTGAVIVGTQITATNLATGISKRVSTGSDGSYEFLELAAPANYTVTAKQSGFKTFEATGIHLGLNQIYVLNIQMELGAVTQQVTVEAAPAQVEKTSMQLGGTITGTAIVDIPLRDRDWIQLQQTLPGVVMSDRFTDNFSTNGSRSQANSYLINGTDANDLPLNTPLQIPSPDAIAEVQMISSTINPEYGRNSGAVLNAVTKSGTNKFHGDAFEFYRDPFLNTRNFFQPKPAQSHQNQFGGTIGGPIWKDHTFFFFSYQGNRQRRPETIFDCGNCSNPGTSTVFTADQRNGIFPDLATSGGRSAFPLFGENGTTLFPAFTPYSTIFPTGHIPAADLNLNPIAVNLLNKYVPFPNFGATEYTFNPTRTISQDQYITRIDHHFHNDSVWFYLFQQRDASIQALPFFGSDLPGFPESDPDHIFQYALAWNHTLGSNALNEVRLGYNRLVFVAGEPVNPVQPSSVGFAINPQSNLAGIPTIPLTGFFTLGFSDNGPQPRIDQTYQVTDNFSLVKGRHTLKFGFEMRRAQVENPFFFYNNGHFDFAKSGPFTTGDAGTDFLLGIPDDYRQSSGGFIDARTHLYYTYAQDQFKVRPNLTVTYGFGWQVDTPVTDIFNKSVAINAFRPGQQSTVFPTAPAGLLFPGDKGITASGYHTHWDHFAPRLGFAWSPGNSRKWSIRSGIGIYYNVPEEELTLQNLLAPPFGLFDGGIGDVGGVPSFAAPFSGYAPIRDLSGNLIGVTPTSIPNKYPYYPPKRGSNVDFGFFEPFTLNVISPDFTTPSSMNYNLTVQGELSPSTILQVAYVGSQGRHLEHVYELNPAGKAPGVNPACAADLACVAFRNVQNFIAPQNFRYPQVNPVTGTHIFGGIGQQATDSNSNYNALQLTLTKHLSHGLEFLGTYSWSHSLDNSSSYEESQGFGTTRAPNPFNLRDNYGDSAFDARNRFVFSYSYELPTVRHFSSLERMPSRLTDGWRIGGATTFQGGIPVTLKESDFNSLTCTLFTYYGCPDRPNVVGPVHLADVRTSSLVNKTQDPTNTTSRDHYFFDPNSFSTEAFGVLGNAGRNFFHGPGLNNFTFGLYKDTRVTESTKVELRFEFYNFFNHTQFKTPNGDMNDPNFGRVLSAQDPRIIQLAAKFYF